MGLLSFISSLFTTSVHSEPEISVLSEVQSDEIKAMSKQGKGIMVKYLGVQANYTEDDIDRVVIIWRQSEKPNKESPDEFIGNLGAYLGELLIENHDLSWCVYKDVRGSDYCITHKKIVVHTFPHSTVYKAAIEGRENAIRDVSKALLEQINEHHDNPEVKTH